MEKRIIKDEGLCPVIKLTECHYPDGSLVNHYSGAGVALIACKDNTILDLEYLTEDPFSNLNFLMRHWKDKNRVYIGMCSCVEFCEPQELIFGKKFSMPKLVDQMDNHMIKHNLTMVH